MELSLRQLTPEIARIVDLVAPDVDDGELQKLESVVYAFLRIRGQELRRSRSVMAKRRFRSNTLQAARWLGEESNPAIKLRGAYLAVAVATQNTNGVYDPELLTEAYHVYRSILHKARQSRCKDANDTAELNWQIARCGVFAADVLTLQHPLGEKLWQATAADFVHLATLNYPKFFHWLIDSAVAVDVKLPSSALLVAVYEENVVHHAWPSLLDAARANLTFAQILPPENFLGKRAQQVFRSQFDSLLTNYGRVPAVTDFIDDAVLRIKNSPRNELFGRELEGLRDVQKASLPQPTGKFGYAHRVPLRTAKIWTLDKGPN